MREFMFNLVSFLVLLAIIVTVSQLYKHRARVVIEDDNTSMSPALPPGRYRVQFGLTAAKDLRPGDAVAFSLPGETGSFQVARVIATEGQEIELREKKAFVDGKEFSPPGIALDVGRRKTPVFRVPGDCVFAMTDNYSPTLDPGKHGLVPFRHILGKIKE